jgi:murein DD-endopeptidase MepM/ murein hydrolase activator NlpD
MSFKWKTYILFFVCISFQSLLFASSKEIERKDNDDIKDTIPAFVMYGSHFLLDSLENFDETAIIEYRDSLISQNRANPLILKYINIYLSVQKLTRIQLANLIDSLFELEQIPYPLINQINLYVASNPTFPEDIVELNPLDTSFYPANCYYNSWNTQMPNPYPWNMYESDSILKLILCRKDKDEKFVMPVENVLTSKFGWRDGRPHKGIGIDLEVWDTVVTAFSGMVRVAKVYGGYGRVVVVRHFNGLETLYAHLHRIKVQPGQIVEAGELIGLGGSSGHSTGSHLHFECRFKGVPINPLVFIDYKNQALVNDTLVLKKTKTGYAAFPEGTKFYEVVKGDSLYEIANKFGMSTKQLAELNGIRRDQILYVGQSLRVI